MLKTRLTFSDLTGWTISGGTAVANGTNTWQSTATTVLTANAGNLYTRKGNVSAAVNCAGNNAFIRIAYWLPADQGTSTDINLYLYSGNDLAKYVNCNLSHRESLAADYRATSGWHRQDIRVPQTGTGGFDPAAITGVGFQVSGANNNGVAIEVDSIEFYTTTELPTFLFTLDDGYAEHLAAANTIKGYGWRGIFSVIPSGASAIGTAGMLTLANCMTLDADGHLIVSHSYDHTAWGGLTTAQKEREILDAQEWLLQNGLLRGADMLTFPSGFVGTQAELDMVMRMCRVVINTNYAFPARYSVTSASSSTPNMMPLRDRRFLGRGMISDNETLTPFSAARIDALITRGAEFYPIMIHQLSGAANRLTVQQFNDACAYLSVKEAAGLCRVIADPEAWLSNDVDARVKAAQLATDQAVVSAAGARIMQGTPVLGTAGTLPTASVLEISGGSLPASMVMASAGGNILTTDVRNDTETGIAAGGDLSIAVSGTVGKALTLVLSNVDAKVSTRSTPTTAQTITPPASMATTTNQQTLSNAIALIPTTPLLATDPRIPNLGTGALSKTLTVTDGTNPLAGAYVRLVEGATSLYGTTNVSGQITFSVDAGTHAASVTKAGYSYTPSSQVVTAASTHTLVMTATSVPVSADPTQITIYGKCVDANGAVKKDVIVHIRASGCSGTGVLYDKAGFTATSDVDGNWSVFAPGGTGMKFMVKRGQYGDEVELTGIASGTLVCNAGLGTP